MQIQLTITSKPYELAQMKRLPSEAQSNYVPYLLGNDTPLNNSMLSSYRLNSEFVVVGTALFRSIDIACYLNQNKESVVPKVIIIDNSRNTSLAWQRIKAFFANVSPDQDIRDFLYEEDGFLSLISELMYCGMHQLRHHLFGRK